MSEDLALILRNVRSRNGCVMFTLKKLLNCPNSIWWRFASFHVVSALSIDNQSSIIYDIFQFLKFSEDVSNKWICLQFFHFMLSKSILEYWQFFYCIKMFSVSFISTDYSDELVRKIERNCLKIIMIVFFSIANSIVLLFHIYHIVSQ